MKNTIAAFAPENIEIIVFDVDDTVTRGTLDIKVQTFQALFADKPELLQEARELYEFTGKGDRYNIIAHTVGEPQEGCQDNPVVEEWARKFEENTQKAIREAGMHPDDVAALAELKEKFSGKVYLLSATPEASVQGNIDYFTDLYPELAGMFVEVIGTPMEGGKAGELLGIAEANNVPVNHIVMVGDGGSDYNGANGAGSQFVGIVPEGKKDKWETESFPRFATIAELNKTLEL